MNSSETHDIAIAGGSYAGLALACALSAALEHQARIAVVERRELAGPAPADPRAYALSTGSKRLLDALGVWSRIVAYAQPVSAIDITDSALEHAIRPILLTYETAVGGAEPAMWIVDGAALYATLLDAARSAPGVTLRTGTDAQAFVATDTEVAIDIANGPPLRARVLVATDGRRSPLREQAGIKLVRWSHEQIGIVTRVHHERPHNARAVQHFLPGGPFAILPMRDQRSCITWTEDRARGEAILALDDNGFLAEVEQRFGHRLGALRLDGPRASWPLEFQIARSMIARRFALAGDAARSVHPLAGQGLNLAFRDVAALAQCLAESMRIGLDPGDNTALERYERWRRFDSVTSAAAFDALNGIFSNDSVLSRAARDAGLGIVDRLPGLKQVIVREAAGETGDVPRLLRGERV
ncbi:MAG TPA: FAD-dependent monooxygenase [Hyphomicrobiaceae bacterium]